jgi:hypothetical protein
MHKTQKDVIIEIIRLIDKHLDICFPQISREKFLETFNQTVVADEYFVDIQPRTKSSNRAGVNANKRNQTIKEHHQDKDEMAFMSNTNEESRGRESTLPHELTAHFTEGHTDSVAESGAIRQGLYGTQVEEPQTGEPPQRYEDVFRIG